jgi:hypothetical protein
MSCVVYDIETASLDFHSELYCIAICNLDGTENILYADYEGYPCIAEGLKRLNNSDSIWGWNNLSFDTWVLREQFKFKLPSKKEHDGIILARMLYSKDTLFNLDMADRPEMPNNLKGSFSLKAFGYRTNNLKIEFEDFTQFTKEMGEYCQQDASLTAQLIRNFRGNPHFPPDKILKIEENTQRILTSQTIYGWLIDVDKAYQMKEKLEAKMERIRTDMRKQFKPKIFPDGQIKVAKTNRAGLPKSMKIEDKFLVEGDELTDE